MSQAADQPGAGDAGYCAAFLWTQGYGLTSLSGNPTKCARAAEHNLSFQIENALSAAAKNG
jgi:hypothetical protein